jgi:hypothetical protein
MATAYWVLWFYTEEPITNSHFIRLQPSDYIEWVFIFPTMHSSVSLLFAIK